MTSYHAKWTIYMLCFLVIIANYSLVKVHDQMWKAVDVSGQLLKALAIREDEVVALEKLLADKVCLGSNEDHNVKYVDNNSGL